VGCSVALGQELDLLPSFCGPCKGYIAPVISAIVCLEVLPGGPELTGADVKQSVGELEGRWPRAFFFENNSARQFPAEYVAPDGAFSSGFIRWMSLPIEKRSGRKNGKVKKMPSRQPSSSKHPLWSLLSNSETRFHRTRKIILAKVMYV
jgi:hypothetical protein